MSWMNVYPVIHYFVEGGQNGNFHLRFKDKSQGSEMTSGRWQHHNVMCTQRLVVQSVDFSDRCCIVCQCDRPKIGKRHFSRSYSKVCMLATQEVLKILRMLF